jgi:adenosylcobyric acid synthase
LFEAPVACEALLRWAGLPEPRTIDYRTVREQAIERLADTIECHLDIEPILALLGASA